MSNPGKDFEGKVSKSLKALRGIPIRLYDGGGSFKVNMPGDFIYAVDNTTYLIECKSTGEKSLPFANIRPHQFDDLEDWGDGSWGTRKGLFAIEFRPQHRMFLIPAYKVDDHMYECKRKSLTIQAAEYMGYECRRVKSDFYDMHVLDSGGIV